MYLQQGRSAHLLISNDVSIKKRFLLGAGLLYNESIAFRGGFCLKKKLTAMFNYNFTTSTLQPARSGANYEADLQFSF